jgi:hypothetical protein
MSDKYMVWKRPQVLSTAFGVDDWVKGSFPCNKELADAQAQKLAAHGFNTKVEEYVPGDDKPPVANSALPLDDDESDPEVKFNNFHAKNPAVYENMVKMARDLRATGHKRIGMQMLIEVIRWQSMIQTTDADFKLNNDYGAYYARRIMAENPALDGIFETRKIRSEV